MLQVKIYKIQIKLSLVFYEEAENPLKYFFQNLNPELRINIVIPLYKAYFSVEMPRLVNVLFSK